MKTGRLPSVLLVIVVLAFATYVYVTNSNKLDATVISATEPANAASPLPAFVPVANVDVVPQESVHTIGHVVAGDTVGLYGGTQTNACDAAQIGDFLDAHPPFATAWAQALRIPVSNIHPYLASLTALSLRMDTAVTNHGYKNGAAAPFQSVLQAGTAVLVDAQGLPRVRCRCGNPLQTPAQVNVVNVKYEGPKWKGFEPESVTAVSAAPKEINQFIIVVHVNSDNKVVIRHRATSGQTDVDAGPQITHTVDHLYVDNGASSTGPSDTNISTSSTSNVPDAAIAGGGTASSTTSAAASGLTGPTATGTASSTAMPTATATAAADVTVTADVAPAPDAVATAGAAVTPAAETGTAQDTHPQNQESKQPKDKKHQEDKQQQGDEQGDQQQDSQQGTQD